MMNSKNTSALIISADDRLKHILLEHTSDDDNIKIRLENNLANLDSIPTSDAYVYDVELTNNDLISSVETISELKKIIANKPLILIGKKRVLSKVLSSENISEMVTRTINKPISYGQLQLVINSCLQKPTLKSQPSQQTNRSSQRRVVVFSLTAAFLLLSVITYLKTKEFPTDKAIDSVGTTITVQNTSTTIGIDSATQEIDKLNQLALIALQAGRLTEPTNNNVSYYLKEIKKTDPYNATANQTHNKLLELLEAAYLSQSQQGNHAATKKALEKILKVEPYNHKYAQLLRELKERIYLENQKMSNDNTTDSATTDEAINLNEKVKLKPVNDTPIKLSRNLPPKINKEQPLTNTTFLASIDKEISVGPIIKTKPAEVIKRTEPNYPRLAVDLNHEGWIELEYQVNEHGQATNIKVVDGEKIRTFEKAAIDAIEHWEFAASIDTTSNTPILSEPMVTKFNFLLD